MFNAVDLIITRLSQNRSKNPPSSRSRDVVVAKSRRRSNSRSRRASSSEESSPSASSGSGSSEDSDVSVETPKTAAASRGKPSRKTNEGTKSRKKTSSKKYASDYEKKNMNSNNEIDSQESEYHESENEKPRKYKSEEMLNDFDDNDKRGTPSRAMSVLSLKENDERRVQHKQLYMELKRKQEKERKEKLSEQRKIRQQQEQQQEEQEIQQQIQHNQKQHRQQKRRDEIAERETSKITADDQVDSYIGSASAVSPKPQKRRSVNKSHTIRDDQPTDSDFIRKQKSRHSTASSRSMTNLYVNHTPPSDSKPTSSNASSMTRQKRKSHHDSRPRHHDEPLSSMSAIDHGPIRDSDHVYQKTNHGPPVFPYNSTRSSSGTSRRQQPSASGHAHQYTQESELV